MDSFISGDIFKKLGKEQPLFSFFISKKGNFEDTNLITEDEKAIIYETIVKERSWLSSPSIPFELEKDVQKIQNLYLKQKFVGAAGRRS